MSKDDVIDIEFFILDFQPVAYLGRGAIAPRRQILSPSKGHHAPLLEVKLFSKWSYNKLK